MQPSETAWGLASMLLSTRFEDLAEKSAPNPGEPNFIPTMLQLKDGKVAYQMMLTPDPPKDARRQVAANPPTCWALASDITAEVDGAPTDALLLDVGEGAATSQLLFPYSIPLKLGSAQGSDADLAAARASVERMGPSDVRTRLLESLAAGPTLRPLHGDVTFVLPDVGEIDLADLGPEVGGEWTDGDGFDALRPFEDSIRPVEVRKVGADVEIRVPAGASPADLGLAVRLAAEIAEEKAVPVVTDGVRRSPTLHLAEFDEAWAETTSNRAYGQVLDALRAGGTIELSLAGYAAALGARTWAQIRDTSDPAAALRGRLARLVDVATDDDFFKASIMGLKLPSGVVQMQSWARRLEALLDARVHGVNVQIGHGGSDALLVRSADLIAALGDRATFLTDDLYVTPLLDDADHDALIAALRPKAVSGPDRLGGGPGSPGGPARPGPGGASQETSKWSGTPITRWDAASVASLGEDARMMLISGYAAVMLLVAGADGNVDKKELNAFFKWLGGELDQPGATSALLQSGPEIVLAALATMAKGDVNPAQSIMGLMVMLKERVAPNIRMSYTNDLRSLGKAVAEASGGSLLFFWKSKIDANEQKMLDALDSLLAIAEG
jgi:hypothetical protein